MCETRGRQVQTGSNFETQTYTRRSGIMNMDDYVPTSIYLQKVLFIATD